MDAFDAVKIRATAATSTKDLPVLESDTVWLPLMITTRTPHNIAGVPIAFLKKDFELAEEWVAEFGVRYGKNENDFYVGSFCCHASNPEAVVAYDALRDHISNLFTSEATKSIGVPWPFAAWLLPRDNGTPRQVAHLAIYDARGGATTTLVKPGTFAVRVLICDADDTLVQLEPLVARVAERRAHLRLRSSRALLHRIISEHANRWFILDDDVKMSAGDRIGYKEMGAAELVQRLPLISSKKGSLFPITFTVVVPEGAALLM